MVWNVINEEERFVIEATGDELALTLPDEILESEEFKDIINKQYNEKSLFRFFVQKKDKKSI